MAELAAYVSAFRDIDHERNVRTRYIMEQALSDESLPPLERYVIGVTGSSATLSGWHGLSELVNGNIGEPLLALRDKNSLLGSHMGTIAGEATVRAILPQVAEPRTPSRFGIYLDVPVEPVVAEQMHGAPVVTDTGTISIASCTVDGWRYGRGNPATEFDNITHELTIGRENIYAHPLFQHGVHHLLLELEQAQQTLQAAVS